MAPEVNRITLAFDAREENVAVARAVVAAAGAGLPFTLPEIEELRIAASEAVSNAVLHAYPDGAGRVELALEVGDGWVSVRVRDWGRGIADPQDARRPEVSSLEGHLGLGFAFMEAMTDELTVQTRVGEGTTVRMIKRARARDTGADPASAS